MAAYEVRAGCGWGAAALGFLAGQYFGDWYCAAMGHK